MDYDSLKHNQISEELVEVMLGRIQVDEPLFFRLMVAYYFSVVASAMRTMIKMPEGKKIPVNMYCLNLAPSNFGKTQAATIIENEVLDQFIPRFTEETFPVMAEENLPKIAVSRIAKTGNDPDEELEKLQTEYRNCGDYYFTFDGGTTAAAKQLRHKLLLTNLGSMNLIMDEVGLHLSRNSEIIEVFMELYDGTVKPKLIKHTKENQRTSDMRGITPANALLFGTSNKLLDGAKQEEDLMTMLESGYGRRCFYGYVKGNYKKVTLTAEESLEKAKKALRSTVLEDLSDKFNNLADLINVNRIIGIPDETALIMYQYKLDCEKRANKYKEHETLLRTEMMSRFFKTIKVAGVYAFIENSADVLPEHLHSAIKLAEESGAAFNDILKREKPYIKLAKYIADLNEEATHADLLEDLPYYPKSQSQRQDMLNLAIAYGYKNNIIIKKAFTDGIEFLRGETLRPTNLDEMVVSYSEDIAYNYTNELAPFSELHRLTNTDGLHWVNHHLKGGHRQEDNALPRFNLIVLDVDGGVNLKTAKLLLKDYKALYYTTKRHTETENRFRIILPTNFELKLDAKDYKEFMANLYDWLPFEVDDQTGQRARKWLSHDNHYEYNDGELVDVLPFIPKTAKNEERKRLLNDQHSLNNLERWVMNNTGDGNRNNMILRYAMILVDAGFDIEQIRNKTFELNDKLPDKLDEAEIMSTVLVSVSKAIAKR